MRLKRTKTNFIRAIFIEKSTGQSLKEQMFLIIFASGTFTLESSLDLDSRSTNNKMRYYSVENNYY